MPGIFIRATGSDKFIRVTDLLTPRPFEPKELKTSDQDWPIDVGGFDKAPNYGSIMIEVAKNAAGPYNPHEGNKLVKQNDVCTVDDSNLPKAAGKSVKKRPKVAA